LPSELEASLPNTVIELSEVRPAWSGETLVPEQDGGAYSAFFHGPLPAVGNSWLRIKGKLLVLDAQGAKKPVQVSDLKLLQARQAVARARAGKKDGLSSSTGLFVNINPSDGSFETETSLVSDGTARRIVLEVSIALRGGQLAKVHLVLERIDLQGFLSRVDAHEGNQTSKQTHLEFLASIRKIYQGGTSNLLLQSAFDRVLFRQRKVAPLPNPGVLPRFQTLYADGEYIDISHVLTGIEGSPRQKPTLGGSGLKIIDPELLVTWSGDLGNALASYIRNFIAAQGSGAMVDMNDVLGFQASRADLLGDIDGINIGAVYDASKTLKQNLEAYYGKMSRKRFTSFIKNSATASITGKLLSLKPGTRKLSSEARLRIANVTRSFAAPRLYWSGYYNKLTNDQAKLVTSMLDTDSPEMNLVVDHFVYFLENGLARE
jgi:hypothetical protein